MKNQAMWTYWHQGIDEEPPNPCFNMEYFKDVLVQHPDFNDLVREVQIQRYRQNEEYIHWEVVAEDDHGTILYSKLDNSYYNATPLISTWMKIQNTDVSPIQEHQKELEKEKTRVLIKQLMELNQLSIEDLKE